MSLKIVEPIREYLKEFETVDEFNKYYIKHKSDIDSQTTHTLNKKYHIKGYRITKIKGDLQLKGVVKNNKTGVMSRAENSSLEEYATLKKMYEDRIVKLEQLVTELIDRYNSLIQE